MCTQCCAGEDQSACVEDVQGLRAGTVVVGKRGEKVVSAMQIHIKQGLTVCETGASHSMNNHGAYFTRDGITRHYTVCHSYVERVDFAKHKRLNRLRKLNMAQNLE